MNDLHRDAADVRDGKREDISLDALELRALEQYYLAEETRMTRELKALEERLTQRANALEVLEARLTQGLNAVAALEARLKQALNVLELGK